VIFLVRVNSLQEEEDGSLDDLLEEACDETEDKQGAKRIKMATVKGPWAKEEDDVVIRLVGQYGPKRWSLIASNLPGRKCYTCNHSYIRQFR